MGVPVRSVEDILIDAGNRGLFLNNLIQITDGQGCVSAPCRATGQWRANFHHATGYCDFGHGATAIEALENALSRMRITAAPAEPDPFS